MLPVTKAHAYGNDFLYVRSDLVDRAGLDPVRLAVAMCARNTGIGADGLILFTETEAGARMRLINSDGSAAEVSGNGVRALGALIARARHWDEPSPHLRLLVIETEAGTKTLELLNADGPARFRFKADMGAPRDIQRVTLHVAGERLDAIRLDMGNPQCVAFGELEEARWARLGQALQHHDEFPAAVNFELAQAVDRGHVRILIWERGAGPTQSSGTGSCAAAVAAITAGLTDRELDVEAPGGTQRVEWTGPSVFLTGWAEVVLDGYWIGDANATKGVRSG